MKEILKIMELIHKEPGKYSAATVIKKFGEDNYRKFCDFTMDAKQPYAKLTNNQLRLTPDGVREYYRLVGEREEAKRTDAIVYTTAAMSAATVALGLSTILEWYLSLWKDELTQLISKGIGTLILILAFAVIFWKTRKILSRN